MLSFLLLLLSVGCSEVISRKVDGEDAALLRQISLSMQASAQVVSFEGRLVEAPSALADQSRGELYKFKLAKLTGLTVSGIDPSITVSLIVCAKNCRSPFKQTTSNLASVAVGMRLTVVNAIRLSSTSLTLYNPEFISGDSLIVPPTTPMATPIASPVASASPVPSQTPTVTPVASPTAVPSPTPSAVPNSSPSVLPMPSPTNTPSASASPTPTPIVSQPSAGADSVFLVVNTASAASVEIAQHYIVLRGIPASNVLNLNWTGNRVQTDVNAFRTGILTPVLNAISQAGLESKISYIIYSSDFPPIVDYRTDIPVGSTSLLNQYPFASITGLTYLQQDVMAKRSDAYNASRANPYYSITTSNGFAKTYGGKRYYMSLMLGVTSGGAGVDVNTVAEVKSYLTRAKAADKTNPGGHVYFRCAVPNTEIRCRIREGQPVGAKAALTGLGVTSTIENKSSTFEEMPKNAPNVIGAFLGTATLFITDKDAGPNTGSYPQLLPGAITEHLTSHGAAFNLNEQSKITQWFRLGAAGSSGTVAEPVPSGIIDPFMASAKFPHAWLHVHYARGFTLGESFYQAVSGPYQLLIVGDPLCKPWTR